MTFALLGLALAAVVVGAIVLAPSGTVTELPGPVEEIAPVDGATVLRQTQVEIDLRVDYSLELLIDGIRIPGDEIIFREATGQYQWRPSTGQTFEEWAPGLHSVLIRWDRIAGLPDPGELRWTFRVQ